MTREMMCRWAYEQAGYREADPPGPGAILVGLVGRKNVRLAPVGSSMQLRRKRHGRRLRATLPAGGSGPDWCERFALAAAEVALAHAHREHRVEERLPLAQAIAMPASVLKGMVEQRGMRAGEIADAFNVSLGWVVARLRTLGLFLRSAPVALVRTPHLAWA
jgi:hypothetical protein